MDRLRLERVSEQLLMRIMSHHLHRSKCDFSLTTTLFKFLHCLVVYLR